MRPVPPRLHLLHGNPSKLSRKKLEGAAKGEAQLPPLPVAPPGEMDEPALWAELAAQVGAEGAGWATGLDVLALRLLCETYAEYKEARDIIRAEGATYECTTKEGVMKRQHPAVAIASDAAKRLRGLLADFGLTPSSRAGGRFFVAGEEPAEEDPADALLNWGRALQARRRARR